MSFMEPYDEGILLSDIVVDGELQSRSTKLDGTQVKRYSIAMKQGDEFPPICLARINSALFVIDGFHRVAAAKLIGKPKINAVVKKMTREEAKWEGGKENLQHGLPLRPKDKLPMFRAYIAARGHRRKRRGAFKTYREMAADFHGHLAHSTILKWIKSYYPSIYSAIGQREPNGPKEEDTIDHGELYYEQAMEALNVVRNLSPTLTNPERRYVLIESMKEAVLEMRKLPHIKPPPDEF